MRKALLLVALLVPGVASADEWGLGLRASGEHVGAEGDRGIDMGGGALLLRWRISRIFGLELEAGGSEGKLANGAYHRKTGAIGLSATVHLNPGSRWDFYLLAGLAALDDKVDFDDVNGVSVEQEFRETEVRLGGGLEYRWIHCGLGIEAAAIGRVRNDADQALANDAIPEKSGGGQLSGVFTFYF